jgi:perosamine synthetase
MATQFEPGAPTPQDVIPLCVPEIRGNEWKYIKDCLDTNWVSSVGSYVNRFEQGIAEYLGVKHAVATVNGTAALHIALLVAGVKQDHEVLVPNITFVAPVNAVRYVGAWPVLIDIDPNFWQMDSQKVVDFIEEECVWKEGELINRGTGRRVKAILPVHILGHPVDMTPIQKIAKKYNLTIIEDATESLGATYKDRPVGTLGDIACFSFNGNKIITTGGGGMIVTENAQWAEKARYLTTQAKDDPLEYIHNEIGYNYRLTNIQAAMGVAQLENLGEFIARKREISDRYKEALENIPGINPMEEASYAKSIYWMSTVLIDDLITGVSSRNLLQILEESKIQTRPLWCPMHGLRMYQNAQTYKIEHSERIYKQALSLPSSVGLNRESQSRVCQTIVEGLS